MSCPQPDDACTDQTPCPRCPYSGLALVECKGDDICDCFDFPTCPWCGDTWQQHVNGNTCSTPTAALAAREEIR